MLCISYTTIRRGSQDIEQVIRKSNRGPEMWIYRRIHCISWKQKQSNTEVIEKLGKKRELMKEIKKRQVKYFGHVKRHDTLIKTILEDNVEGKRARGRQRYKWEDNIKRWMNISLTEYTVRVRDRQCWRSIAANFHCGDAT